MIRGPPRFTRNATLFPYTTPVRSRPAAGGPAGGWAGRVVEARRRGRRPGLARARARLRAGPPPSCGGGCRRPADLALHLAPDDRRADVVGGDRKSVVSGKSVSVRVDFGCRRVIKTKTNNITHDYTKQIPINI